MIGERVLDELQQATEVADQVKDKLSEAVSKAVPLASELAWAPEEIREEVARR